MQVCPYCLTEQKKFESRGKPLKYNCSECKSIIPRSYAEMVEIPRASVGLVGFSGHGKTVYLTSLFSTLSKLSRYWNGYYYRSLDDYTHNLLYEKVPAFDSGELPDSTPANFPHPAIIQYNKIPTYKNSFINFYDTAGETYNDVEGIQRNGRFVANSNVIFFIISIEDCEFEDLDDGMCKLLDTYITAVYENLSIDLKTKQEIVVVFTKADLIMDKLPEQLKEWLLQGEVDNYGINVDETVLNVNYHSGLIAAWLSGELKCDRFMNMLNDNFIDVKYTIVSSTGLGGDESEIPNPLRVVDPFFAILKYINPTIERKKKRRGFWNWLFRRR